MKHIAFPVCVLVLAFVMGARAQQAQRMEVPVDRVSLHPASVEVLRDRPASGAGDAVGTLIKKWYETGEAAGNIGDVYYNRDGGHSLLPMNKFPQVRIVRIPRGGLKDPRYWGLCTSVVPHTTVGNSSTASGAEKGGSNARIAYANPRALVLIALQYIHSNLFVYPEHEDHDAGRFGRGDGRGGWGDLFPFNTPYLLISQGSSGSDRDFMEAVFATLAAFPPETKEKLRKNRLLMPAVQMILRRCRSEIETDEDYLSGRAHPTVFEASSLDPAAMVKMAHAITPERTPPISLLKVIEESESRAGIDFFVPGRAERFAGTPSFVGRVYRGPRPVYRMVVSAEGSADLNGRDLRYHWVVLRGRTEHITINPLNDDHSRVEIRVPYRNGRLPSPGRPGLKHARVDIACFVHNGEYFSPPAFVCFYMPPNEVHTVIPERDLVEIGRGVVNTDLAPDFGLQNVLGRHPLIRHWDKLFDAILANDAKGTALREWIGDETTVTAWQRAAERFKELNRQREEARTKRDKAKRALIEARKKEGENVDALSEERERTKERYEEQVAELTRWLVTTDEALGTSPQQLVEGALENLADTMTLLIERRDDPAAMDKRTARRVKDKLARLHSLRIVKTTDDGAYELNPLRPGDAPAAERLTDYERATLRAANLRVVNELLGRALSIPSHNPVERRVVLPTEFRDVYHYTNRGELQGWMRYHPDAEPQAFTADGRLIVERDAAGEPTRTAAVSYEAVGRRRHRQKLKMTVAE